MRPTHEIAWEIIEHVEHSRRNGCAPSQKKIEGILDAATANATAAERERCAKIADGFNREYERKVKVLPEKIAAAIRAEP